MAESQSGTVGAKCGALTADGSPCENRAGDDGTCHLDGHIPDGPSAESGADNAGDIPEEGWWESHAEILATLGGVKTKDGEPTATDLAMAWANRAEMSKSDAMAAVFGRCPECDRGINGFDSEGCNEHDEQLRTGDNTGEAGDDEITVTIDGSEVTGTPEDIRALKGL